MTPRSLTDLQERIPVIGGTRLWKSLDQLADTPEFREAIEREFPDRSGRVAGRPQSPAISHPDGSFAGGRRVGVM